LVSAEFEIVADMLTDVLAESGAERVSVMAEVGSTLRALSKSSEADSDAEKADDESDKENNGGQS
jgi:hypothetical protein